MNRQPTVSIPRAQLRDGAWTAGERDVAEETAIAIVVDGGSEAVMLATPADIEDFAHGFALTERIVASLADIRDLEIVETDLGIEARLWLKEGARANLVQRRRRLAGPVGCGLCGVESLEDALPPVSKVDSDFRMRAAGIVGAMGALLPLQPLNQATRAVHAAAFFTDNGPLLVREDVGRHNALDKLVGALAREGRSTRGGAILMTSRVSIELVQKAATIGAPILAAVSAPTALALRTAEEAGISVCGIVRDDGLEVFTHGERILHDEAGDAG